MTRFVRVAQAAARTGLTERCIRRAIAQARLSVVRPPGVRAVLISEDALAQFIGVSPDPDSQMQRQTGAV